MGFSEYFPIWNQLTAEEQRLLSQSAVERSVPAGTVLHNSSADCVGLLIVRTGQLRAFILSDEGKEMTLYRLFDRDICLFSASCILSSIQFDVTIEAQRDTQLWMIPAEPYKQMMSQSAALANYTNQLMSARFSEVMWLVEQIMWKSFDKRLAAFLLEESAIEQSDTLKLTHDKIAAHLGTAREVVTRMLRYFQSDDMVELSRGSIVLKDPKRLGELAHSSKS